MRYNFCRPFGVTSRPGWLIGQLLLILAIGLVVRSVSFQTSAHAQTQPRHLDPITVDDFESYSVGSFPDQWIHVSESKEIRPYEEVLNSGEKVLVKEENGNKFVRLVTRGEALRFSVRNGEEFTWDLEDHPRLEWQWRALKLPAGASEKGKNDTGGAIYVTFGTDWLGRPKSIKYTYSSSLPVGTIVSFGPLRVIVVSSGTEPYTGEWKTVRRDVIGDYEQVFGGQPPDRPVSITFWSDTDTTKDSAKVDIDNIQLLPEYRR